MLSAMIGVVVFGAVRLASARDGAPGIARTWVTFAGVVTGLPGDPRTANMRFSFHRVGTGADAGVPPTLCAPTVRDVSISSTGAFSAQIPLDDSGSPCPSDLFDGRDVQIDIDVGAETVVRNATVNPVPYAHFASVAGQASGAVGRLEARLSGLDAQESSGWRQIGTDRYVFDRLLVGADAPACPPGDGGLRSAAVDIGVPAAIGTSRDRLWSGRVTVFATHPPNPDWAPECACDADFFGVTTAHNGLLVRSQSCTYNGAARELTITRVDDFGPRLWINVPCGTVNYTRVVLHVEAWIRTP